MCAPGACGITTGCSAAHAANYTCKTLHFRINSAGITVGSGTTSLSCRYATPEAQKQDWKLNAHKEECAAIVAFGDPGATARLVAKLIWKR